MQRLTKGAFGGINLRGGVNARAGLQSHGEAGSLEHQCQVDVGLAPPQLRAQPAHEIQRGLAVKGRESASADNRGLGFGSFSRQRRKRSALSLNVFLVRPSIGQSLAVAAFDRATGALAIVNAEGGTVGVAEIEFV